MKSIATFETTVQVTEDQWVLVRHVAEVDDSTTIGQIIEWANSRPGQHAVKGEARFSILPAEYLPHVKRDVI
jgi:hypothetical protein